MNQNPDDHPDPPRAAPRPTTLERHGRRWSDEYAWLRDPAYPNVKDPAVLEYLHAENRYFDQIMAPWQASVTRLIDEFKARIADVDAGVPWRYRNHLYRWRFEAGADYRVWERATIGEPTRWTLLIDERARAAQSDYFDLGGWSLAPDERHLALAIDLSGDEHYTLFVEQRSSGARVATIENTLGEPVWSKDSDALFYLALDESWRPAEVRRWDLSTGSDTLVYAEPDSGFRLSLGSSQSEALLLITASDHETSEIRWLSLADAGSTPQLVAPRRRGHDYDVDHDGRRLVIRSNREERNFSLYGAALTDTAEEAWQLLRAGGPDRYLTGHCAFGNGIVSTERHDGLDQIVLLLPDQQPQTIEFPDATYAVGLGHNAEPDFRELRLSYESLTRPHTVFDYTPNTGALIKRKERTPQNGYDATRYHSERLLISSRDGTPIPVSLVYCKDYPPAPERPLYLYGYGAYGLAMSPGFSSSRLSLLDRGISFAIAHVRGGDELGYGWYEAGKAQHRTNTFNDFVDVARGLISRTLTGRGRIALVGGSAGGELVAAAVNQDPTIAGAAVLHVPFVDVLNTMLDASLPLTPIEWPEWGNPIDDVAAFDTISSYSPYDQLKPGAYPPMLVTAGLNDPRVTYWEPAKYVARLRSLKRDRNLLLLKTNMEAGHGGRSGRYDALQEVAEEYQFLLSVLPGVSGT